MKHRKRRVQRIFPMLGFVLCLSLHTTAQEVENTIQSRTSLKLSFSPIKKVKLNVTPELRFDENFSLNNAHLEGELVYSPFKYLSLSSAYRFVVNPRETKTTEYLHRIALAATVDHKIDRFTTALKFAYSNYADDESSEKEFLRYKGSVKYNIPKSKITPYAGVEAFQQWSDFNLYKIRYSAGLNYKIIKNNSIGIGYKFDYYMTEYKNKHIFSIGYKYKF